jgi:hypothetical protein
LYSGETVRLGYILYLTLKSEYTAGNTQKTNQKARRKAEPKVKFSDPVF